MRILLAILILLPVVIPARVSAQNHTRIRRLKFEGNIIIQDNELASRINTRSKKTLEKILFWKKKPEFVAAVLKQDIGNLISYYNRNGFLHPDIGYVLDSVNTGKLVDITINIKENGFVNVGRIDPQLKGDSATFALLDRVKNKIPLKNGSRFRDDDVFQSETMLKKQYSDNGFPFASVSHAVTLKDSTRSADILFRIVPGERSYFGIVSIEGDTLFNEKFLRKYIRFSEAGLFRQNLIDSTQQDLFGTGLFRYVVIASEKDSMEGDRIPVKIVVRELPRWALEAGIGYGTEDKLRLAAQVTRLNFLGGTRKLIVNAKTSYFNPFNFDVRFVQPDFLIPRLDLIVNPFYMRDREISYKIDRMGGSLRLNYQWSRRINTHFSYSAERDRILELTEFQADPSELKHNKSVFSLGGEINSANDPFYPSKGYKAEVITSLSGLGYRAAVHFYRIELSLVNYFSGGGETILATKLHTGVLQTMGSSLRTPIEERFYLGGATSLRGWGRHRISPLNEAGIALGGNTMAEGSAELRFPVYKILHGAIFTDAGNVFYNAYDYGGVRLHYNAGVGLRIRTPIGPVRLDFATPVINDGFNLQFFISVGQAF